MATANSLRKIPKAMRVADFLPDPMPVFTSVKNEGPKLSRPITTPCHIPVSIAIIQSNLRKLKLYIHFVKFRFPYKIK